MRRYITLSRIVNVAILFAALMLGLLLYRAFSYPEEDNSPRYKIVPGARLTISGVDFSDSQRSVLLALSKSCRYCNESAPFYKRLGAALKHSGIRVIALFPENETGGESYLQELGITAEVHSVPLTRLGVTAIPTLVIADNGGSVLDIWNGKMPPRVQSVVFERLNLPDTRPKSEWLVHENDLAELLKRGAIVLDVRDREKFWKHHIPEAVNIPVDELHVRASNELSSEHVVVLTADDDVKTDIAYTILEGQGFSQILTLLPGVPK